MMQNTALGTDSVIPDSTIVHAPFGKDRQRAKRARLFENRDRSQAERRKARFIAAMRPGGLNELIRLSGIVMFEGGYRIEEADRKIVLPSAAANQLVWLKNLGVHQWPQVLKLDETTQRAISKACQIVQENENLIRAGGDRRTLARGRRRREIRVFGNTDAFAYV